jgi:UDP-perosamine 4-acetyltransferase
LQGCNMSKDAIIIGAGGHGKVVLDILRAEKHYEPIGFLDADPSLNSTRVGNLPVLGQPNLLNKLRNQKVRFAIVAIGDNRARMSYAKMLAEHEFELINAVHPRATLSPTAQLGVNCVIAAGAVVATEARIGDSVIVNTQAVVEHECEIADGVHVAPGALLAGRVRVGEGAFIGLGARVIQCLSISAYANIGAGAVVLEDVAANVTAVGVPARVVKPALV